MICLFGRGPRYSREFTHCWWRTENSSPGLPLSLGSSAGSPEESSLETLFLTKKPNVWYETHVKSLQLFSHLALALYEVAKWFHWSIRVNGPPYVPKKWKGFHFWCQLRGKWFPSSLRWPWRTDLLSNSLTPSDTVPPPACCYRNVFWGRGEGAQKLNTLAKHQGRRGNCTSCVDLSLSVPVSDKSLYESVCSAARHSSDSCTTLWRWDRGKGYTGFKPKPAGWREAPACGETEGRLCQIENEGANSTSGFTQVKSPAKDVPLTWWGVTCPLHLRAFKRPAINDLNKEFCQSLACQLHMPATGICCETGLQNTTNYLWFLNKANQIG